MPGKTEEYAHCTICKCQVKVLASGVHDVKEHLKSNLHQRNARESQKQPSMMQFTKANTTSAPKDILSAELHLTNFIVQHNLPLSVSDHLCELLPKVCPDNKIATKIKCRRTKTTQIVKKCLAPEATRHVIEHCRKKPFSLLIDESNDQKPEKRLVVLVRIFSMDEGATTRTLDVPLFSTNSGLLKMSSAVPLFSTNSGTAGDIFNKLDDVLR